jgi:ankyrin repeat protein
MNESSQKKIDYSEHEKCLQILKKNERQIRDEDNDDKSISDSSRMDSHIKSFESHLLGLHREIAALIQSNNNNKQLEKAWGAVKEAADKVTADGSKEAADKVTAEEAALKLLKDRNEVPVLVVGHFKEVMEEHKRRTPKWYNDDSQYRWAVSEMLQLLDSAMAVPLLTPTMFEEWSGKLSGLRQASRMVRKEARRHLLDLKKSGAERQERALEICKQSGIVVEYLEELNEMQETPLIREAAEGGIRSVRLLLEAGADVHAKQQNTVGFRALNQAAYFGHPECINDLVNWGADVNALDGHGGTPLVAAALNGEIECVRVLLAFKADVNKATKRGSTPLMKAARYSHNKVVRMLIVAGADKDLKDGEKGDGKTAREIAEIELKKFEKIAEIEGESSTNDKEKSINDKEKSINENKKTNNDKEKSPDHIRAESCLESLRKTPEQIRAEDWESQKTTDTGQFDTCKLTLFLYLRWLMT